MIGFKKTDISKIYNCKINCDIPFFVNNIYKESCGLVFGIFDNKDTININHLEQKENLSCNVDEFWLPIDQLHNCSDFHNDIIGIFHNHLIGFDSCPSFVDEYYMNMYPLVWVIISQIDESEIGVNVYLGNRKLFII